MGKGITTAKKVTKKIKEDANTEINLGSIVKSKKGKKSSPKKHPKQPVNTYSSLDSIQHSIAEIRTQHHNQGNDIQTIKSKLEEILKNLNIVTGDQKKLKKLEKENSDLLEQGKINSNNADKAIGERDELRENEKGLNSQIKDLEKEIKNLKKDNQYLERESKSPIDKFKHLICNESDLSEVISAIEKQLFENKNSHKSGLLNAIMILDSLAELKNLKKEYGKNAKEIFSYTSEKEMAQLFSTYLCKAYNKKNIIELNDLNILIDAFNSRADHYEILHYPEKQEMLDDKIHMLINDSDSAMRVDKYHSLPIKPKATDLAAAKVVKALVEAI